MNLLLLDPTEIEGDQARVRGARATHIRSVLRKKPGDQLKAGVLGQGRATATLLADEAGEFVLRLGSVEQVAQPRVRLIIALPRPKALSRLLQTIASFGVAELHLVGGYRVDKSYFESPRLVPARLLEDLWLGAEQGAQTWIPEVHVEPSFRAFIDERLQELQASSPCRDLLLHPAGSRSLQAADAPACTPVRLALGPEGGWTTGELACFERARFAAVRLGSPILRTESAVAAALGQLLLLDSWTEGDEHRSP